MSFIVSIKNSLLNRDVSLEMRGQLLEKFVLNHRANAWPFACSIFGLVLAQWVSWPDIVLWVAACLVSSGLFYLACEKFQKQESCASPSNKWIFILGATRLCFILTWASVLLWAWNPVQPATFMAAFLVVIMMMAVGASVGSPCLLLYLLVDVMPPVLVATYAVILHSDVLSLYLLALIVMVAASVIKVALTNNKIAKTLLQKTYDLDIALHDAERANQAKSAFLATMSHEIRNPLNGILGLVHLLRDLPLGMQQKNYTDTILYSGDALMTILNDILDFSKIEAGKMELENIDFDLYLLVNSVRELMKSRAAEKNLILSCDIAEEVPRYIKSDPTRLRQLLINFVSNAIKFTDQGKVLVVIDVEKNSIDDLQLRFEIHDTGPGISPEGQAKLFNAYSQTDLSVARQYGGTGLGLSICKQIVDLMNGETGIQSEIGHGSVFWFVMPIQKGIEIVEKNHFTQTPNFTVKPLTILLAEDNHINIQVATGLLEKRGHKVISVLDGEDVVPSVLKNDFDIILMDMHMARIGGLEAAKRVKGLGKSYKNIPIVALTGSMMPGDREKYHEAGIILSVSKPIEPQKLYEVLAEALGECENTKPRDLSSDTPIDLKSLVEMENTLGRVFVDKFVEEGIPEVQRLVNIILQSAQNGTTDNLGHAAHELKSLSALFGLCSVSHVAKDIEKYSFEHNHDKAWELAPLVGTTFQSDLAQLQKIYVTAIAA